MATVSRWQAEPFDLAVSVAMLHISDQIPQSVSPTEQTGQIHGPKYTCMRTKLIKNLGTLFCLHAHKQNKAHAHM